MYSVITPWYLLEFYCGVVSNAIKNIILVYNTRNAVRNSSKSVIIDFLIYQTIF
jgi:hypothetical protein